MSTSCGTGLGPWASRYASTSRLRRREAVSTSTPLIITRNVPRKWTASSGAAGSETVTAARLSLCSWEWAGPGLGVRGLNEWRALPSAPRPSVISGWPGAALRTHEFVLSLRHSRHRTMVIAHASPREVGDAMQRKQSSVLIHELWTASDCFDVRQSPVRTRGPVHLDSIFFLARDGPAKAAHRLDSPVTV